VYNIATTDMFRPLVWPSAGWQEQEYNHNYNVLPSVHR